MIAEAAGQYIASCAFPVLPESARWRRRAARVLEREIVRQNLASGLNREQATDYHGFVAELFLAAAIEGELTMLDRFDWKNKRVLEIGLGQGSESEQLIKRGAIWSGIDLTGESVKRVHARLALRHLPYEELKQASALDIPFPAARFDVVFSHGVLHHIPDILRAQCEIRRVVKDDGRLIVMLYAKNSLNYQVAVKWVKRLGLALVCVLNLPVAGIYRQHQDLAKREGLWNYDQQTVRITLTRRFMIAPRSPRIFRRFI